MKFVAAFEHNVLKAIIQIQLLIERGGARCNVAAFVPMRGIVP